MYNEIVHKNLNKTAALKKLKVYNLIGEAKNKIINNVLVRKEELSYSTTTDSENDYLKFTVLMRNNFCYRNFIASTIHLIFIGILNSFISIIHQLASLIDIKKEVSSTIKLSMEQLASSGADFVPKEILVNNKIIGWIGNNYVCTSKIVSYMYRHMDMFIEAKSKEEINVNNYSSKMYKNYLLLYNLLVPSTIKQKKRQC